MYALNETSLTCRIFGLQDSFFVKNHQNLPLRCSWLETVPMIAYLQYKSNKFGKIST